MIEDFNILRDSQEIVRIHKQSGLPDECIPQLLFLDEKLGLIVDPLFVVNRVMVDDKTGRMKVGAFARGTAELYLILDHSAGTPEERWEWLQEMAKDMIQQAATKGLRDLTAWIPPELEKSFEERLKAMGFIKSPWRSYTLPLP